MPSDDDFPHEERSGFITLRDPPLSVFLVDDDQDFREIAERILREDGYEVTALADGVEALEGLAAMADAFLPLPDVLILDFVLPRLSGLGVLRALWHLGRFPPTLIVTGFADPSVEAFAKNLGAVRVLRKPIDRNVLCAAVREAASSVQTEVRRLRGV
jgi:CheY-like chemotaxis protein